MNNKTKKEFTKQFFSYFLVIFIPIIILNMYYQNHVINLYKTEIITQNNNNLNKFQIYLDNKIDVLNKLSNHLMRMSCFSTQSITQNSTVFYDILKELNAAKALEPSLLDIYYYNKVNPDTLYSCNGTYNITTYSRVNPLFLNEYANFESKLNNISIPLFQSPQNNVLLSNTPSIEYIVPTDNQSTFFIFRINPSFLNDLLSNIYDMDYKSYTCIFSESHILYENLPQDFILPLSDFSAINNFKFKVTQQDEHYISYTKSPNTNLIYMNIIDENLLLQKVRNLSNRFILFNMIILFLGFSITFILTHRYYKPIKRLIYSLCDLGFSPPNNLCALEQIALSLNQLDANNKHLNYEKSFLKLLSGAYKTIEDLNADIIPNHIQIQHKTYRIITLNCPTHSVLNDSEKQILAASKLCIFPKIESYQVGLDNPNMFVWITFYDSSADTLLKENICTLYQTLSSNLSIPFKLCISNTYEDLTIMPYVFLECSNLCQHSQTIQENEVIFYEEADILEQKPFYYPGAEISSLQDAIEKQDIGEIESFVSTLIDYINNLEEENLLIPLAYIITSIFENAVKTWNIASFISLDKTLHTDKALSKIHLIEYICTLKKEVINLIQLYYRDSMSLPVQKIINYINEHYCEYNLSVSSLADHFNLSVSNLSHQFKAATGANLSTYINSLRIQQAKCLLSTTSMTVADIACAVGYTQSSSFIRRFKQFTNVTPGEFRVQENLLKQG